MRILIIDDDRNLASCIKRGLEADRLAVDVVETGQMGIEYIETYCYDLILLNHNVTDIKGQSILRRIRRNDSSVPIVVLAPGRSLEEKVQCFEFGADDYIVKPASFAELRARVHAVLRRCPNMTFDSLTLGGLTLDCSKHRAMRGTRPIDLTSKEYLLLEYLMRNRNRAVSRRNIVANIWGMGVPARSETIDTFICRLRGKTEANSEARIIHTIRGVGYLMQGNC